MHRLVKCVICLPDPVHLTGCVRSLALNTGAVEELGLPAELWPGPPEARRQRDPGSAWSNMVLTQKEQTYLKQKVICTARASQIYYFMKGI